MPLRTNRISYWIFKPKKWFLVGVIGLTAFVGYWTYLDISRDLANCPSKNPGTSAFLVLNTLDTSSKKINATFMVPSFNKGEDSIEVLSVNPTSDPELNNYEPVLKVSPTPTPSPEASPNPTPAAPRPWTSINLPYNSQSFLYPFESYVLNIQIDYLKKNSDETPIILAVENRIDETIMIKKCEPGYSFDKNTTDFNSLHLILRRHRFVRLMAVILYIIAICFLVYIARLQETKDVLTSSLGYIAALWGIRGIIIGPSKLFPTIIDFITLILYVAVFIIVVYRLLFNSKPTPSG